MVFQKKEDLLSLYNALNGSSYTDPDELEVNTLGNVLYLTRKNDISFLISGMMNLYEHQSTFNPNMPVRGLIYLCRLYEKYIVKNEIDIYTSSLKELPFPQYFVFYNGTEKEPDRQELKLSDMFKAPPVSRTPALECIATMLNINYGHNKELMEKCQRLREYAVFVETVRQELSSGTDFDQSVTNAVDICINGNILKDILTDQKAEVIQMILETYDKELHDKTLRHEGYEDGYNKGSADGYSKGSADGYSKGSADGYSKGSTDGYLEGITAGISNLISTLQELHLSREETLAKILEKYDLSAEDAENYMSKYWKV